MENSNENPNVSSPQMKPEGKAKIKIPTSINIFTAIVAVLLAVLITFMTTFALLDRKYKEDYNDLVSTLTGDSYYTLEYVKQLFAQYYTGDLSELSDDEVLDTLIRAYILQTGDLYAYYWNAQEYAAYLEEVQGEGVGIGVLVNYLEDQSAINVLLVYENAPAENAGIEVGDLIVGVDGERISEIGYNSALAKMKGEVGSKVKLTVLRDGAERLVTVKREEFTTVSVVSKMLSDEKTGYIRILQFDGTTVEQFAKAYLELSNSGAEHFVFDVRDNPGGQLDSVMGVLSFLLGNDVPLIEVSDKSGSVSIQKSSRALYCKGEYASSVDSKFKHTGKTVILTNKGTASAGELFTAALHQYSTDNITVGVTTYGKGVMQRTYALPNGGALKLTFSKYTAPGVDNYDGVGLVPDIEQKLSEDAANKNLFTLTETEDTQLQKALGVLYGEAAE